MTVIKKTVGKAKRALQLVSGKTNLSRNIVKFQMKKNHNLPKRPTDFERHIEIIVPCYNHAQYLKQTFASILDQTWKKHPITVTFVDDNSTDDTQNVIKNIKKTAPKNIIVKSIKNITNLRQHGSLNKAINESKNDLIIILNDDDLLVPDCLEKVIVLLNLNRQVYLVGGSSIWFEDKLPKHTIFPFKKVKTIFFRPEQAKNFKEFNDINMTHSSTSFFKVAWEAVGGYREKNKRLHIDLNEDRDFQMRMAALFPVAVINYPLAYWRTDSSHGKDF